LLDHDLFDALPSELLYLNLQKIIEEVKFLQIHVVSPFIRDLVRFKELALRIDAGTKAMMMAYRPVFLSMKHIAHLSPYFEQILDLDPHLIYQFLVALLPVDLRRLALLANVPVLVRQIGGDRLPAVAVPLHVGGVVDVVQVGLARLQDLVDLETVWLVRVLNFKGVSFELWGLGLRG
jgi:hypothetical protein